MSGVTWKTLNALTVTLAGYCAIALAFGGLDRGLGRGTGREPLVVLPVLIAVSLVRRHLYRPIRAVLADDLPRMVPAISTCVALSVTLCLIVSGEVRGPQGFLKMWAFMLLGVSGAHLLLELVRRVVRHHSAREPVVIVGAGAIGTAIVQRLRSDPGYGLEPVCFVDDDPSPRPDEAAIAPVLGRIDQLRDVLIGTGARRLILAFSHVPDAEIRLALADCEDLGITVGVVPRMFESLNDRASYEPLGSLPMMSLDLVDPGGKGFAVKYALDRVIAAIVLLPLVLPMGVIALLIRMGSPGPALIRQRRVGRDGRAFEILKFRTMRVTAGSESRFQPLSGLAPGGVEGVDRRTTLGRLLRRTSLDELPQLVNVLRGEMSLVGPRPERGEFAAIFEHEIDRYQDRHRVKSGITGWAQVNGLRGQTSLRQRVEFDNYYIAHWSLGFDLKIVLMTLVWLLRRAE